MLPESVINDSPAQRRFDAGQAERMVRKWNASYPPGTAVKYWNRYGDPPVPTTTRGAAYLADSGVPLVDVARIEKPVSLYSILPEAVQPPLGRPGADTSWLDRPIVAEAACDVDPEDAAA